jgi:hypothetical protein
MVLAWSNVPSHTLIWRAFSFSLIALKAENSSLTSRVVVRCMDSGPLACWTVDSQLLLLMVDVQLLAADILVLLRCDTGLDLNRDGMGQLVANLVQFFEEALQLRGGKVVDLVSADRD